MEVEPPWRWRMRVRGVSLPAGTPDTAAARAMRVVRIDQVNAELARLGLAPLSEREKSVLTRRELEERLYELRRIES